MVKLGFLGLLLAAVNISAAPIRSYQELTSALRQGDRFVIVLDLEKCSGKSGMPTGYFAPSAMMLVPATEKNLERVATSHLHFTDHTGTPAYEYTKYTFNSDNTVQVRTVFYDPATFKPVGTPHTFNCSLGNGVEINS
jgi:hypothetical protein